MRLTTKGRYAVTAILDLALHQGHGPITLADIAERQGISLSYLEQLFAQLRRRGLVSSTRGPGGGYNLGRPASQISVAEVITAVDESLDVRRCAGKGDCHDSTQCLTHDLWTDLTRQIHDFLDAISLEGLMQRRDILDVAEKQDHRMRFGDQHEQLIASTPTEVRAPMSITLSEKAADYVKDYLARRGHGVGLRVGVKTSGCSGLSYVLEYADAVRPEDIAFESHGVTVVTDPKGLLHLDGSELDLVREGLNVGLKFNNPNVKDACGCGESFTI